MGSWQERIDKQERREEEIRARDGLRREAQFASARQALQLREAEIRRGITSVILQLGLVQLLTSLNNEIWKGLGVIETTNGTDRQTESKYQPNPVENFWTKVSLIYRYQRYSPVTEDVTKLRFGDYTKIEHASTPVDFGVSETHSYEVQRFGFHRAKVGVKTLGVKSEPAQEEVNVKVSSSDTSVFVVNFHGSTDYAYDPLRTDKGDEVFGYRGFSCRTTDPLARQRAIEILAAFLTRDSRRRMEHDGITYLPPRLPQNINKVQSRILEEIRSEIGQIKPISPSPK